MPTGIFKLSEKIVESQEFCDLFTKLQRSISKRRFSDGESEILKENAKRLILQASVLSLSEEETHRQISQKVVSLLHELFKGEALFEYAIQIICSRIGNYPVISSKSEVFSSRRVWDDASRTVNNDGFEFSQDIMSGLYEEESAAKFTIADKTYYFNLLQKEVLAALDEKILISFSAPTSFGKSFVVKHYLAKLFVDRAASRALIVLPTKSLIDDFFSDLQDLKNKLHLDLTVHSHARTVSGLEDNYVFILTQERLSFLIDKDPEFVKRFQFVYVDEAHSISRGYRGFLLRHVLLKTINLCPPVRGGTKYVFTSPIIKNPDYYRSRLFSFLDESDVYHREIRYSPVEKTFNIVAKSHDGFKNYILREFPQNRRMKDRLEFTSEINVPSSHPLGQPVERGEIQNNLAVVSKCVVGNEKSILYMSSPLMAHSYAAELARVRPIANRLTRAELTDLKRYIHDHYDSTFRIIDYIEKGVGLHYGAMPIGLRRIMVKLFEDDKIDLLLCTSTLLEGVNLPAKNIFVFSKRHSKQNHTSLTFWNLVGRAGRMTYGLTGNVFCIGDDVAEYQQLIDKTESEICDPEKEVVANKTKKDHIKNAFLVPEKAFKYTTSPYRQDLEFLISEILLSDSPEDILDRLSLTEEERGQLLRQVETVRNGILMPKERLGLNPGIDPRLQDALFRKALEWGAAGIQLKIDSVSSVHRINTNILEPILNDARDCLYWPKPQDNTHGLAGALTVWINEAPISSLISYRLRDESSEGLARIGIALKYIVEDIDRKFSYEAPRYLKCYFNVLQSALMHLGYDVTAEEEERVESFLFALESGLKNPISKFLFEKGISRTLAIRVNTLIAGVVSGEVSVGALLQPNVLTTLQSGLSSRAFNEFREHLLE